MPRAASSYSNDTFAMPWRLPCHGACADAGWNGRAGNAAAGNALAIIDEHLVAPGTIL